MNASYDFTQNTLQYGELRQSTTGTAAVCKSVIAGFELGSLRDEGEWLWGFTLSSIGTAGNIHRNSSVFPTPASLNLMY